MSKQEFQSKPARWFDDDAGDLLYLKVEGIDGESSGDRTAVELLGRLGGGGTDLCGSKLGSVANAVDLCGSSKPGGAGGSEWVFGAEISGGFDLCGSSKPAGGGGAEWVFGTHIGAFDFLL